MMANERVLLVEDEKLIRIHWPYIDRADDEKYIQRTLISNVEDVQLRFLNAKKEWKNDLDAWLSVEK